MFSRSFSAFFALEWQAYTRIQRIHTSVQSSQQCPCIGHKRDRGVYIMEGLFSGMHGKALRSNETPFLDVAYQHQDVSTLPSTSALLLSTYYLSFLPSLILSPLHSFFTFLFSPLPPPPPLFNILSYSTFFIFVSLFFFSSFLRMSPPLFHATATTSARNQLARSIRSFHPSKNRNSKNYIGINTYTTKL